MSVLDASVIDVHAHAVIESTFGTAGRYGPELGGDAGGTPWFRVGDYVLQGVRYRGSPFMDVERRLAAMAQAGIDYQVLSPNPLTYFHFVEARVGLDYCTRHNDAMAALVAPHRERLGAFAALPMQDIDAAIAELTRAVHELDMYGGYIGTDLPHPLDGAEMDRLYAACVALDVPLFIHPGPAGIDGPAGDPRLRHFDLDVITGFSAQETIAVATLIYGGVLHRHPKLDVCLSHGGGSLGYLYGRMEKAARKRPWAPDWLKVDGAFDGFVHRLWFDCHVHDQASLALLTERVGVDRLVFGSNFAGWDQPDGGEVAAASPRYADNARRLLRVSR